MIAGLNFVNLNNIPMTHSHQNHDLHDHHDHSHSHHNHHGHHGHSHAHELPINSQGKTNLAFLLAILGNFAFTLIEIIFSYLAHSNSLLADAAHNLGDVLGLIFSWIALLLLQKSPNAKFSYGFKKTSIIASLINALILLSSIVLIFREAAEKFIHPSAINAPDVMLIAFIGILINSGTALLFIKNQHNDLNIRGAFLHLAYDALVSFGVVITAGIIYWTHWEFLDPLIGIGIGLMILWGTWSLLGRSISLIMDGVPQDIQLREVESYLLNISGVTGIHDLHIWGLSTQENALTAHLIMPSMILSDNQRHEINQDLKNKFKINHVTIQIERGDGDHDCKEHSC